VRRQAFSLVRWNLLFDDSTDEDDELHGF